MMESRWAFAIIIVIIIVIILVKQELGWVLTNGASTSKHRKNVGGCWPDAIAMEPGWGRPQRKTMNAF